MRLIEHNKTKIKTIKKGENIMRKGIIIFVSIAIMVLASVSLFAQYGRGYGRRDGAGYCGNGRGYNMGYRYNNENRYNNYTGCYNNMLIK